MSCIYYKTNVSFFCVCCLFLCFLFLSAKMPGSTVKSCISCMMQIRVACKICKICGAQQPLKKNIQKAKEKHDRQWGEKVKMGGNTCKLVDSAHILVRNRNTADMSNCTHFKTTIHQKVRCTKLDMSRYLGSISFVISFCILK